MRRREAVALACAFSLSAGGAIVSCSDDQAKTENPIILPSREDAGSDVQLPPGEDIPVPPTPKPDCDPNKPFGTPVLVPGFDSNVPLATPRLSPDELTIYFTARDPDGGLTSELARAVRSSRSAPFGPVILMTAQSSPANDNDPSVALDHLSLWFHSGRNGVNTEIYFATRATTNDPFGAPALVPNVNSATANDAHAYYRAANGGELWFVSQRGGATYDIYVAKRQGVGFAEPAPITELNSAAEDWQPAPSEDGLRVLIATNRDGGAGGFDLWLAERSSVTAKFGAPKPIPEINSAVNDFAGWMSADGCRVYFSSARDTTDAHHRLWFAERPK